MTSLATTHITPELCNSFVRQQTKLCGDNHPACPSITVEKMPKRVIDVSPYEPEIPFGLVYPRLIATKGLTDPWVTLSYCWGSDGSMVTATKASISGFMEKIDVSALPKTFQDAIMVVKAIGHRYLCKLFDLSYCCDVNLTFAGIDALCIIQVSTCLCQSEDFCLEKEATRQYFHSLFVKQVISFLRRLSLAYKKVSRLSVFNHTHRI